jgi:hypothetical protein
MPGFGRGPPPWGRGIPPGVGRGPPGPAGPPWPAPGRGPPGRGPAPGAPGAPEAPPGRDAPERPPPGACGRGMPVLPEEVNGLLPGRGPTGRGPPGRPPPGRGARSPPRAPPSRGPGPGRCAGRGPGAAGRGPDGVAGDVAAPEGPAEAAGDENSAAGAGCAGAGFGPGRGPGAAGRGPGAGAEAEDFGAGVTGLGAAGRAVAPGAGDGLAGACLRGADGLAALEPAAPPFPCCSASVSLRTTGASIVEDAERTNSPSSWSLAMTTLLSTPNSLASSYTRTLATSLLLVRGGRPPDRRYFMGVLIAYSSSAHRNLDLLPTREVLDRTVTRAVL